MSWIREITKLVRRIVQTETADIHTHLPAQIVSYTAATNTCSVRACINRMRTEDPDNLADIEGAVLEDVPVHQFGSGLVHCTCPPTVGSYGSLHISERSIEKWFTAGGVAAPTSARRFDISDAIFLPGLFPVPGLFPIPVATDRVELRTFAGTSYVSVLDDGSVEIGAFSLGTITIDIDGTITASTTLGDFTLDGTTGNFSVNGGNLEVLP